MIAKFEGRRTWSVVGLLVLGLLALLALTDARTPLAAAAPGAVSQPAAQPGAAPADGRATNQPSAPGSGAPPATAVQVGFPAAAPGTPASAPAGRNVGSARPGLGRPAFPGGVPGGRTGYVAPREAPSFTWTTPKPPDPKLVAALDRTEPQISFKEAPLREVLDALRNQIKGNFNVHWKEIEAAGISLDNTINLTLADVSFAEVLRQVLRQAGENNLGFRIDGNIIVITTKEILDNELTIQSYDISPVIGDGNEEAQLARMSSLVELLRDTVSPASWVENGGKSTMRLFNNKLIVITNDANHTAVQKVLQLVSETGKR